MDLVVEGRAKPGHEAEWRRILEHSFDGNEPIEGEVERFAEICIPPFECVGAPRVGFDGAADAWIIEARNAGTPEQVAEVLSDFHGYYVLQLVKCDGIPEYSHGGLYEGVDETSFRGAFLSDCTDVLPTEVIEEAWGHKFPDDAVAYGRKLLAVADDAEAAGTDRKQRGPKPGLLSRLMKTKPRSDSIEFEEQLRVTRAAGRWFVFWGEHGHAIRAWF